MESSGSAEPCLENTALNRGNCDIAREVSLWNAGKWTDVVGRGRSVKISHLASPALDYCFLCGRVLKNFQHEIRMKWLRRATKPSIGIIDDCRYSNQLLSECESRLFSPHKTGLSSTLPKPMLQGLTVKANSCSSKLCSQALLLYPCISYRNSCMQYQQMRTQNFWLGRGGWLEGRI